MEASRMAELFDIKINLGDEDDKQDTPAVSFDHKIADINMVLKPAIIDAPAINDTELIKAAISAPTPTVNAPSIQTELEDSSTDDFMDIPDDILDEVDKDIQSFQNEIEKPTNAAPVDVQTDIPETAKVEHDNPLGLEGSDLKAYQEIKKKYPDVFVLYNGSISNRDIYKYKVHSLKHLLGQFPLLDLRSMRDELASIRTNHFIGDDLCTPDLIRIRLDASYVQRTRLCSMLTQALEQFYAWERFLDMLRSKIWKDHELKGAHKKDGMVLEHLSDMENYVKGLEGFIEAAKQYDSMCKAAAESLSRQLTCIQLTEYAIAPRVNVEEKPRTVQQHIRPSIQQPKMSVEMDSLDFINEGAVISAPKPKSDNVVATVSYGQEDEFSQLG